MEGVKAAEEETAAVMEAGGCASHNTESFGNFVL